MISERYSVEVGLLEAIEKGRRFPTVSEVASVSGATGLPVGWFLEEPEQLVACRRTALDGGVSPDFDLALEALAFRIRKLRDQRILSVDAGQSFAMPQSHDDKKAAETARTTAGAGLDLSGPHFRRLPAARGVQGACARSAIWCSVRVRASATGSDTGGWVLGRHRAPGHRYRPADSRQSDWACRVLGTNPRARGCVWEVSAGWS